MTPIVCTPEAKLNDGNPEHEFGAFSLRQEHWHDKAKYFSSKTWRQVQDWAFDQFVTARELNQFRIVRLIWNLASGSGALAGMKTVSIVDQFADGHPTRILLDISDAKTLELMEQEERAFFDVFGQVTDVREFGIGILNENNFAGNACPFSAEDIRKYYEMMYSVWGRKLSICVGGSLGGDERDGKWVPPTPIALFFQMFRDGGPLADKRPQSAFQDSYGVSNWESQYKIAEMHLGYWPKLMTCEVEGIANQWIKLGRNVKNLLTEFEAKYQFLRNMGSWPIYEGADEMVERMKAKVAEAVAAFRAWVSGYSGTPEPAPEEPPATNGGTYAKPVTVRVVGGLITAIETVASENPKWADAIGKDVYMFTSEHPAKVSIAIEEILEPGTKFIGWDFPEGNPVGGDGPIDQPSSYFRTDTRGTDMTVMALFESTVETDPVPAQVTREDLDQANQKIDELIGRVAALEAGKADKGTYQVEVK